MKTEDLNRIHDLGFWITIDWNLCFSIDFPHDTDQICVLVCSYENMPPGISFSDMIEQCIDIFYEWHGENIKKIDKMTKDDLYEISIGNITKRVRRNLSIDRLL